MGSARKRASLRAAYDREAPHVAKPKIGAFNIALLERPQAAELAIRVIRSVNERGLVVPEKPLCKA